METLRALLDRNTLTYDAARKLAQALKIGLSRFQVFYTSACRYRPTGSDLGAFVRQRRTHLGLAQADLAKALGVSKNAVSLIELGKFSMVETDPSPLAAALKVPPEELLKRLDARKLARHTRDTALGQFLTSRRRELGLTLKALAEISGTSISTVYSIERDGYARLETLNRLAAALDVTIPRALLPSKELLKRLDARKLGKRGRDTARGQFLRSRRLELGLTLQALAEMVGTSSTTVHLIERYGRARLERLNRIAAALDVTIPRALLP
jgi:transcriptional regulator with XRE-family HTH domain